MNNTVGVMLVPIGQRVPTQEGLFTENRILLAET